MAFFGRRFSIFKFILLIIVAIIVVLLIFRGNIISAVNG